MTRGRLGDISTAAIGNAAGAVADPTMAWRQVRLRLAAPALIGVVLALVVGFLLGRLSRR
jgi:hypothetical protein